MSWDGAAGSFEEMAAPAPPANPKFRQVWLGDPRWSADGRYVSVTRRATEGAAKLLEVPRATVWIFDAMSWQKVDEIPAAQGAFVLTLR